MAWLGFFAPNSYAATRNQTHVSLVTSLWGTPIQDALPAELPWLQRLRNKINSSSNFKLHDLKPSFHSFNGGREMSARVIASWFSEMRLKGCLVWKQSHQTELFSLESKLEGGKSSLNFSSSSSDWNWMRVKLASNQSSLFVAFWFEWNWNKGG